MTNVTYLPMIALAAVLIAALATAAFLILRRWRTSRAPSSQRPPEQPTREWLAREGDQSRHPSK
ncbi:hypothetical protein [Neorhizobium sp. NCHU2750]|uniref:hypothetical protein n=1 Tax=Neorhizobium sp. NCHU2750 TaxID=1825976 RepID=UPI000E70FA77|nr:hypothetical protein NCHU2750_07540 [Neorhizobium sp. NCHU2750]